MNGGPYALEEIFQADEFVGGVRVLVGEAESQQNSVQSEDLFKLHNNRYRSALPLIDGFLAEPFFQRRDCGLYAGAVDGGHGRFSAVDVDRVRLDTLRGDFFDVLLE